MTIAFVVGNGTSRRSIDLTKCKQLGKVYGCNALYRDFDPDYLIAVDTKMIIELNNARYQMKVPVWTNRNKAYEKIPNLNFFEPSKGWSSGPTALFKASEDGHDEIYILGFDYLGIGEDNQKVNNMYAGTYNYKKENDRATYFGNWLKQTVNVIRSNYKKRYIRVAKENPFIPKDFANLDNLEHITIEDFTKKLEKISNREENGSF